MVAARMEAEPAFADAVVTATRQVSQFVAFDVGASGYGVDIMAVREIRGWSPTTALPNQPYGARGVLDIRGQIVEVFDLSAMLGGSSNEGAVGQVVLVVALGDRNVGFLVDRVSDIVDAGAEDFAEPPQPGGKVAKIVRQDNRLLSVLDLDQLFN